MYPLIGNRERKKTYYQAKSSYDVVDLDYLEDTVIKGLIADLDKITVLKDIDEDNSLEERKIFYTSQVKKMEEQKKKLLKKYLDGVISETMFDSFMNNIEADLLKHKKEIEDLERLQLNKTKRENNAEILKEYLSLLKATDDRHELKAILKVLIKEVRMVNNFRPVVITNIF